MFRDTLLVTENKTLKIIAPHLHFGQENKLDIPVNVFGLTPSQIEFFELSYEAKMLSLPLAVSKRIFSFFFSAKISQLKSCLMKNFKLPH